MIHSAHMLFIITTARQPLHTKHMCRIYCVCIKNKNASYDSLVNIVLWIYYSWSHAHTCAILFCCMCSIFRMNVMHFRIYYMHMCACTYRCVCVRVNELNSFIKKPRGLTVWHFISNGKLYSLNTSIHLAYLTSPCIRLLLLIGLHLCNINFF